MKKLFSLLACFIIFCTLLASCGTGNGNDGENDGTGNENPPALEATVGENGNWWISSIDTGISATSVTVTSIEFDEEKCMIVTFSDGQILNAGKLTSENHPYGEWLDFDDNASLPCGERRYYRACADCDSMQIKNGTDNDHVYSDSYESTGEKHWKVCTLCGTTALEGGHTYDTDNQCTVCGRQSGNQVYWDETELTFEINEHTNYGQTDNYFVKRYYAGDPQGRTKYLDRLVTHRNESAEIATNVKVNYTYLPATNNSYAAGSNVDRIYNLTRSYTPGKDADIYCNFVKDMTVAVLKGCFANLKTTGSGQNYNFFSFNDPDYISTSDTYFDAYSGDGYLYNYMSSMTLSDDKLYLLASDYTIDVLRQFTILPVNVSMMNSISNYLLPRDKTAPNPTESNIEHFYRLVWEGNWTYSELATYAQAVYFDLNQNNVSADATANYGDRLGFAIAASTSITSTGLMYSNTIRVIEKTPLANNPAKYRIEYSESHESPNSSLSNYAEAIRNLLDEYASNGITIITNDETGTLRDIQAIRAEFAQSRILFGGVTTLGDLDRDEYQAMRSGEGFGFAPVPLYKNGTAKDYNTVVHSLARIVGIARNTINFTQCTAYLDYLSRNSTEALDAYCTEYLARSVNGEKVDDNNKMLIFIRNHANNYLDPMIENLFYYFNDTQSDSLAPMRLLHEYFRLNNYRVISISSMYREYLENKNLELMEITMMWNKLDS